MVNRKSMGNECENALVELLRKKGYWVHLFAYNKNGQPCDVICFKDNRVVLIDVKHCDGNRFDMSRVEPNQRTCFAYANKCGATACGLAVFFASTGLFHWLPYNDLTKDEKSFTSENLEVLDNVL